MSKMIKFDHAQELLLNNCEFISTKKINLKNSLGHYLAETVIAPIDQPPFNQSAMDGYAIRFSDFAGSKNSRFKLIGEVAAGSSFNSPIKTQETVRIFTGAALPTECDTVIMQEYAQSDTEFVTFEPDKIIQFNHVRFKGEQIKAGEQAIKQNQKINSATIAFIASLGINEISIFRKPKVTILVTGDELQSTGKLIAGRIFESNGIMLRSLLNGLGIIAEYINVPDQLDTIRTIIEQKSADCDVILVTGGVSVGDYDFTTDAVRLNNYETIFHGVAQKPGKPILFAKKNQNYLLGLPGNPRSVFVCFYNYVYPLIQKLSGSINPFLPSLNVPLAHDYKRKKDEKSIFLSGFAFDSSVEIKGSQGSHILNSLIESNCLINLREPETDLKKGDFVRIMLIPF